MAGATYPLVDPTFTPDGAVSVIEDGTFNNPGRTFLDDFPYIGLPYSRLRRAGGGVMSAQHNHQPARGAQRPGAGHRRRGRRPRRLPRRSSRPPASWKPARRVTTTARFHTGVHHRSTPNGWTWTAVFPEVTEGRYQLLDDGGLPMADVTVTGGNVHQLDMR